MCVCAGMAERDTIATIAKIPHTSQHQDVAIAVNRQHRTMHIIVTGESRHVPHRLIRERNF